MTMTQQATEMRGKTVVAIREGRDMGTADEIYMNPSRRQVAGLTVRESRFGGDGRFVAINDIEQMGDDFIFVPQASACRKKKPTGRSLKDMIGMQVTTREGTSLGLLVDMEVDEDWKVSEMDLSGKRMLKLEPKEITFGDDMILVSKDAGSRVRSRKGGKKKPGFLERVFGSESVMNALESASSEGDGGKASRSRSKSRSKSKSRAKSRSKKS